MSQPHSKTVRGTLDNPKTQEAIKNDKRVQDIGDPTSLKPANDDDKKLPSNDSAPPSKSGAPTVSTPYESKGTSAGGGDKRAVGNGRDSSSSNNDLPHSQKVRGTLANNDGKEVNPTQLGDPASLKAETSSTKLDRDVESAGAPKSKL